MALLDKAAKLPLLTFEDLAANEIPVCASRAKALFSVPETHVASAIGYLLAEHDDSSRADEMAAMFDSLATPEGWALCADLLKVRLQLRAGKLRQTRDVEGFYRQLKRASAS